MMPSRCTAVQQLLRFSTGLQQCKGGGFRGRFGLRESEFGLREWVCQAILTSLKPATLLNRALLNRNHDCTVNYSSCDV